MLSLIASNKITSNMCHPNISDTTNKHMYRNSCLKFPGKQLLNFQKFNDTRLVKKK